MRDYSELPYPDSRADFASYAQQSAETYYDYLSQHNTKGIAEAELFDIELSHPYADLYLYRPLRHPDDVQVRIYDDIYENDQIRPIFYNPVKKMLRVRLADSCIHILDEIPVSAVRLISDLRFLVRRVGEWYRQYGSLIAYPPRPKLCLSPARPERASDNQWEAVTGSLSSPLSYVWGAPGTGKTRLVLANCILAYYRAEKRVFVVAPTNNALEQVLSGVLAELEAAGESISRVLRLGTPTQDFSSRYPEVCENKALDRLLQELDTSRDALRYQIAAIAAQRKQLHEYKQFLDEKEQAGSLLSALDRCADEIVSRREALRALEEERALRKDKIMIQEQKLSELSGRKQELLRGLEEIRSRINKYDSSLFRAFYRSRREQCVRDLSSQHETLDKLLREIEAVSSALAQLQQEIQELGNAIGEADASLRQSASSFDTTLKRLSRLSFLSSKRFESSGDVREEAAVLRKRFTNWIADCENHFEDVAALNAEELLSRHEQLEQELASLDARRRSIDSKQATEARLSDALLVAMTVDGFISRINPEAVPPLYHVFLDEAAYCSLIKGAVLLSLGCPVTFFGDHKQLSPICEMSNNTLSERRNQSVVLWAQSVLHIEEVLSFSERSPFSIYRAYDRAFDPDFSALQKFDLTCTYRFGSSLSGILTDFGIYSRDFHSAESAQTEIFYIHAQTTDEDGDHDSLAEREAVAEYLHHHPGEEIGVLTPFRDQHSKLNKALRYQDQDSILTVHRSQGREWDTVLFSVACTNKHYFVDSNRPIGKTVVNTALSRARKRIVIICDAAYWSAQRGQLIQRLLSAALPLRDI